MKNKQFYTGLIYLNNELRLRNATIHPLLKNKVWSSSKKDCTENYFGLAEIIL